VLDVLVAGGGLAGFAAALRTIELGLSVLVIEQDERLRGDSRFGPTKIVEPDYGPSR
jgi:flavin-dependent dehydrogenase